MARISQGMVIAAIANLNCIYQLAKESFNGPSACYAFHARSANGNIETLTKAGKRLPEWIYKNAAHLRVQGWRIPDAPAGN